jgi:hypothetical protein
MAASRSHSRTTMILQRYCILYFNRRRISQVDNRSSSPMAYGSTGERNGNGFLTGIRTKCHCETHLQHKGPDAQLDFATVLLSTTPPLPAIHELFHGILATMPRFKSLSWSYLAKLSLFNHLGARLWINYGRAREEQWRGSSPS